MLALSLIALPALVAVTGPGGVELHLLADGGRVRLERELRDLRNDPRNHRVRDTDANYIPALQLREK